MGVRWLRRSSAATALAMIVAGFAKVDGFPDQMSDNQFLQCATGTCPDMHGDPAEDGDALTVAGKADGGTYTPGETLNLANSGGGEYSLGAFSGGTQLVRTDNAPATVTAPQAGTLVLISVRAAGRSACTYEKITLNADGGGGVPPGGGGVPPGGGNTQPPVGGVTNPVNTGGSSGGADFIPDAGTGLVYSTALFLFLHVLQRHTRAFLKARKRQELFKARQAGRSSLVGQAPPPPGQGPPPQYGQPPPPTPPASPPPSPPAAPPPPPSYSEEYDTSDWVPQWDESGNQYFWNQKTGEVQWEAPGLAAPKPPPSEAVNADYGAAQGYGIQTPEVQVEILPALPVVDNRRRTLSREKGGESERRVKLMMVASKRIPFLDVSCIELTVFGLYVLLNVLWATLFAKETWTLASSYGYLTCANGLFVVIPASRNSLWAWLLGLPFDKTITIHRWIGRLTFIMCTLHIVYYFTSGYFTEFGDMFAYSTRRSGVAAYIALLVVFLTSLERLRRRKYQVFYTLHFSFLFFYLFGAMHAPQFQWYGWLALFIYAFDKLQRIGRGIASKRQVDNVQVVGDGSILRVSVLKPRFASPQLGQYVFLCFPEISKWEWHPYTLASSPLETHYEVDIKALGDHTKKLLDAFQSGSRPVVKIDGPYGRVVINPRRYRSLVFVCGGIGVTPMISMLRWYYLINAPQDVAAKQSVHLAEYVYFVWVVDTIKTYEVFKGTILQCVERSKQPGFPTFVPMIHVTREQPDAASYGLSQQSVIAGRPDVRHVLGSVKANAIKRHAVYFCGPRQLCNSTWAATTALSDQDVQFAFHHETFEF
jgi:predicted ferric reductase